MRNEATPSDESANDRDVGRWKVRSTWNQPKYESANDRDGRYEVPVVIISFCAFLLMFCILLSCHLFLECRIL